MAVNWFYGSIVTRQTPLGRLAAKPMMADLISILELLAQPSSAQSLDRRTAVPEDAWSWPDHHRA